MEYRLSAQGHLDSLVLRQVARRRLTDDPKAGEDVEAAPANRWYKMPRDLFVVFAT